MDDFRRCPMLLAVVISLPRQVEIKLVEAFETVAAVDPQVVSRL